MFDMTKLKTRYFDLKLKNGQMINVEPPRIKTLKKIMALSKVDEENISLEDFNSLVEASSLAFSKNKQNTKLSVEYFDNNFDIDSLQDLLKEYFEWIDRVHDLKN